MPDDPVERAFDPRIELLFGRPYRQVAAMRHRAQLRAAEGIGLRFILSIEMGYAPTRVNAHRRHGKIPTHPQPAITTPAAIADCQLRLHPMSAQRALDVLDNSRRPRCTPLQQHLRSRYSVSSTLLPP